MVEVNTTHVGRASEPRAPCPVRFWCPTDTVCPTPQSAPPSESFEAVERASEYGYALSWLWTFGSSKRQCSRPCLGWRGEGVNPCVRDFPLCSSFVLIFCCGRPDDARGVWQVFFLLLHAFKRNIVTETNAHVSVAKMIKIYCSV